MPNVSYVEKVTCYHPSTVQRAGIPPEDKVVITQTYKLLTDNVQAEDVLDRLQQGQVVKVNDRQEILAYSKNSDRMQVLLPKVREC